MKRTPESVAILWLVASAALFVGTAALAQVCTPSTPLERQYRTAMKHRAPGPARGTPTAVGDLLTWPFPASLGRPGTRLADAPIDPRETQAFTLVGSLWRVKVEDNDCDLHLELSAPGASREAPRVIAEVPTGGGYELARETVLRAAGGRLRWRAGDRLDLETPVTLRLTGFAFWDGAHGCSRGGIRGCSHGTATVGTLWELHPVWGVEVLSAGPSSRAPTELQRVPVRAPSTPPAGRRVRCCDGTTSPTCTCGRADLRGCCSGHGGACGGCEP